MALKQLDNGQYVIKTRKQAKEALVMMQTLADEIKEIRKANDLDEMEQDAVELKKAVTGYCTSNSVERLDFENDGSSFHGTLVAGYDKRWVLNNEDLASMGRIVGAKSLRSILRKKLKPDDFKKAWNRVTKRVVDPEGIEELVSEGVLTDKDVAPALVEKPRTPYLRIYAD